MTDTPTPASAWGVTTRDEVVTLPSGKAMRVRRGPCMRRLVREGVIPNPLLGAVIEFDESTGNGGPPEPRISRIDFGEQEKQHAAIVCAIAVDPPVTLEPVDGAVLYDAIDDSDVQALVAYAQEGVKALDRFRTEPASSPRRKGGKVLAQGAE